MDSTQIEQYLTNLADRLINESKRIMLLPLRNWEYQFPNLPAVFIFIEANEICFVGETKDLRVRMRKFSLHKNDRFKRGFGVFLLPSHPDLNMSKEESISDEANALIANKIAELITFAYIQVNFGRAELKDLLDKRINAKYTGTLGNTKPKSKNIKELRKTFRNAYKRWSTDEDHLLTSLFYQNKTINELADIFKRRTSAIRNRIEKLKL